MVKQQTELSCGDRLTWRAVEPGTQNSGTLAVNVLEFGRLLRRAGLPTSSIAMLAAEQAVALTGVQSRSDFRDALRATLLRHHEHQAVFEGAFDLFWRDHAAGQFDAASVAFSNTAPEIDDSSRVGLRRIAEAFHNQHHRRKVEQPVEVDASLTVSDIERLRTMDFELMTADEVAAAKRDIRNLQLPHDLRQTRRQQACANGAIVDMPATLRSSLRHGGELIRLARSRRAVVQSSLTVLCDISGSMARYAQILIHFLHAVSNDRKKVNVFLFGTRLSNITRQLRHRDPDDSFSAVAQQVPDWSGGTRIGDAISQFNHNWAKRVLGQDGIVLLVTDGLDRNGAEGLDEAMERLHKSCRRLIWLNPLLRWEGFEPKSQGMRAILPHVDEFRPVHNIMSVRALVSALSRPTTAGGRPLERQA